MKILASQLLKIFHCFCECVFLFSSVNNFFILCAIIIINILSCLIFGWFVKDIRHENFPMVFTYSEKAIPYHTDFDNEIL